MALKLRPSGLSSAIDKDRPDHTVYAASGMSAASGGRPAALRSRTTPDVTCVTRHAQNAKPTSRCRTVAPWSTTMRRVFHPRQAVKASPHRHKWMLSHSAPADPSDPWNSHAAPVSPRQNGQRADATSGAKVSASQPRIRVGRALKPIVVVFAVLYFLIDALFFGLIKTVWHLAFQVPDFLSPRTLGSFAWSIFHAGFVRNSLCCSRTAQTDWSLSHSVGTGDRRNVRHRRW